VGRRRTGRRDHHRRRARRRRTPRRLSPDRQSPTPPAPRPTGQAPSPRTCRTPRAVARAGRAPTTSATALRARLVGAYTRRRNPCLRPRSDETPAAPLARPAGAKRPSGAAITAVSADPPALGGHHEVAWWNGVATRPGNPIASKPRSH
jgi:hypothetical protein